MLTPPLATLPDRTKNRWSGVSRRTQVFVSFEMVVMTPGEEPFLLVQGSPCRDRDTLRAGRHLLTTDGNLFISYYREKTERADMTSRQFGDRTNNNVSGS